MWFKLSIYLTWGWALLFAFIDELGGLVIGLEDADEQGAVTEVPDLKRTVTMDAWIT